MNPWFAVPLTTISMKRKYAYSILVSADSNPRSTTWASASLSLFIIAPLSSKLCKFHHSFATIDFGSADNENEQRNSPVPLSFSSILGWLDRPANVSLLDILPQDVVQDFYLFFGWWLIFSWLAVTNPIAGFDLALRRSMFSVDARNVVT